MNYGNYNKSRDSNKPINEKQTYINYGVPGVDPDTSNVARNILKISPSSKKNSGYGMSSDSGTFPIKKISAYSGEKSVTDTDKMVKHVKEPSAKKHIPSKKSSEKSIQLLESKTEYSKVLTDNLKDIDLNNLNDLRKELDKREKAFFHQKKRVFKYQNTPKKITPEEARNLIIIKELKKRIDELTPQLKKLTEEGKNLLIAYDKGLEQDLHSGLEKLKLAAKHGEPKANHLLGRNYYEGKGWLDQDFNKAVKYLSVSADSGDLEDQMIVAKLYYEGDVVKRDYDKAFEYFELAAHQVDGDSDALFFVGQCYSDGTGVIQDDKLAVRYFEKAIAAENAMLKSQERDNTLKPEDKRTENLGNAEIALALANITGKGVKEPSLDIAQKLLEKSVNKGNTIAQDYINSLFERKGKLKDGVRDRLI